MKRLSVIFLSLIMCIAFFGCSANTNTVQENKTEVSEVSSVLEETVFSESTNHSEKSRTQKETSSSSSAVSKNTNVKSTSASSKTGNVSESSISGTSEKQSNPSATTQKHTTTAKGTTAKTKTTTSSTITCTVTVECKSILSHMDNLKAGHEAYVPSNGYMINGCTVTVKNGSSAYDAVKTACDEQGVHINAVSSSYGIYVAGFNNIDEKDCGSESGWLYSVNGRLPSKSCGKYILSNGDNVVFTYTCSYK